MSRRRWRILTLVTVIASLTACFPQSSIYMVSSTVDGASEFKDNKLTLGPNLAALSLPARYRPSHYWLEPSSTWELKYGGGAYTREMREVMNATVPIKACRFEVIDLFGFGIRVYVGQFTCEQLEAAINDSGMRSARRLCSKAAQQWLGSPVSVSHSAYSDSWRRTKMMLPIAYEDNGALMSIDYIYSSHGSTTVALVFYYQAEGKDIDLPYDSTRLIKETVESFHWQ